MKFHLRRRTKEVKGRARSANAKLDPYNWDGSSPRLFFFVRVLVVVVFLPCNCNCSPSVFGIFVLLVFFGFVFLSFCRSGDDVFFGAVDVLFVCHVDNVAI